MECFESCSNTPENAAPDGEDYQAEGGLRNRRGWAAVKVCLCDTRGWRFVAARPPSILSLALHVVPALNPPHASETWGRLGSSGRAVGRVGRCVGGFTTLDSSARGRGLPLFVPPARSCLRFSPSYLPSCSTQLCWGRSLLAPLLHYARNGELECTWLWRRPADFSHVPQIFRKGMLNFKFWIVAYGILGIYFFFSWKIIIKFHFAVNVLLLYMYIYREYLSSFRKTFFRKKIEKDDLSIFVYSYFVRFEFLIVYI